jgi:hypothetical protein
MTKQEMLERDVQVGNSASLADDYIMSMLTERQERALAEACSWFRAGAEGDGRALCYVATLNEVRAMREEHATRINRGVAARQKLYGETTAAE